MTAVVGIIMPVVPTAPAEEHASERTRVDTSAVMDTSISGIPSRCQPSDRTVRSCRTGYSARP
jgi:hypothetical protein